MSKTFTETFNDDSSRPFKVKRTLFQTECDVNRAIARAVASAKEARGHHFSAGGHEQVERRRRECRGAAGAEWVGCGVC